MNVMQCGSSFESTELRRRLFDGDIVIVDPTDSSLRLAALARDLVWEAFTPLNPLDAHKSIGPAEFASVLQTAKSRFANHAETRKLVAGILVDLRCNLDRTYVSSPQLQTMANSDYLATGPARPFHPHRDTWYAAPRMQINWWLPVFDMPAETGIAFFPEFWGNPIANTSSKYNHDEWTARRRDASVDPSVGEPQHPTVVDAAVLENSSRPAFKPMVPPGGIVLFSAAHLHATVENRSAHTRFSIDFRTVDVDDIAASAGASNVDSEATGTTLRGFLRADTSEGLSRELVAPFDAGQTLVENG